MSTSLYDASSNVVNPDRPYQKGPTVGWSDDLPLSLKDLVVTPISFDVFQEYELLADRICGRDDTNQPCCSAFRLVQTQLRSDDDEVFYERPAYAESLTSWLLIDERWLICRTTLASFENAGMQSSLSVSDDMPR